MQAGENRDVAAGDRDHVIRARLLQPPLHVVVEAGAIADDDGRDDGGRLRAPAADGARRSRGARRRAPRRSPRRPAAAREHLDERAALHRADQRRPAPRQRALVVGHARIEIARRPAQLRRHADAAAGAPLVDARRRQRPDDGDERRRPCTGVPLAAGRCRSAFLPRRSDSDRRSTTSTLSETPIAPSDGVRAQHALDASRTLRRLRAAAARRAPPARAARARAPRTRAAAAAATRAATRRRASSAPPAKNAERRPRRRASSGRARPRTQHAPPRRGEIRTSRRERNGRSGQEETERQRRRADRRQESRRQCARRAACKRRDAASATKARRSRRTRSSIPEGLRVFVSSCLRGEPCARLQKLRAR